MNVKNVITNGKQEDQKNLNPVQTVSLINGVNNMPNENFFSNENIIAMMDGNTRAYKVINKIEPLEEKVVSYCLACGWPMDTEYEKAIQCHIECKGELNGT